MIKNIKTTTSIILIILLLISQVQIINAQNNEEWWNNEWSSRQEIQIPFDTNNPEAKYQPIDEESIFENNCWGKSKTLHSIRVIFQKGETFEELESQIYNLKPGDDAQIKSCNLVFLIPEEADGTEKYYVYYDETEKSETNYPDRVNVEEAYYLYEPIPGFPFELSYFEITQEGNIIYGVSYGGEFLGLGTAQQITKFIDGTEEVTTPETAESWASFDYFYAYGEKAEEFRSTIQNLVSKKIYVDGNLMIEVGVASETSNGDYKSNNRYKYYYTPVEDKKIFVHVKHEATEPVKPISADAGGNIAGLQVGSMRSPSIKELNFGKMFPYMHVYSEDNTIREYRVDMEPEYTPEGTTILTHEDDVDMGSKSWSSFDYGETGEAQAIILGKNKIIKQGENEREGVQVLAIEGGSPGLLGLKTSLVTFYLCRNLYEKGTQADLEIPGDFIVEYDALFFSSKNGGYIAVDKQAEIYQNLLEIMSDYSEQENSEEKSDEVKYTLDAYVHLAPSVPMGPLLSLVTGKNLSYISAELYKEKLICSDIAERISMRSISETDSDKPLRRVLNFFDFKNFSIFKKVRFKNLEPGTYVLKIYRVNPLFGEDNKYIGYKKIVVEEDTKTHIFCRNQGELTVSVSDQKNKGVKNIIARINQDNVTVSQEITDENGFVSLKAPIDNFNPYTLQLIYNGFIFYEEPVKLGFIKIFIPVEEQLNLDLYDLKISIKDTWGLNPEATLSPYITSDDIAEPVKIYSEKVDDFFVFKNLYPGKYSFELSYKSYNMQEIFEIPFNKEVLELIFHVEYQVSTSVFNTRGIELEKALIVFSRNGRQSDIICDKNGFSEILLPLGVYDVEVYYEDDLVGRRSLNVIGNRSFDLVTSQEPLYPFFVSLIVILSLLVFSLYCFKKKQMFLFFKGLVVCLLIISIIVPWWSLHASSSSPMFESNSRIYLLPPELITISETSEVLAGERGFEFLPEYIMSLITLFSAFLIISCILLFINSVFEKYERKKLATICHVITFVLLVLCISVFYAGVATLTKVSVETFIGEGVINFSLPGENVRISAEAFWGPSLGFYLCLISIIIVTAIALLKKKINKML